MPKNIINIILGLFLIDYVHCHQNSCGTTNGTKNPVIWPSTATSVASQPMCIDNKNEPVFRKCDDGAWEPEPKCSSLQPEELPKCPKGFTQNNNICYIITEASKFPPKCPFNNVLPFDSYKHLISGEVWMPVKRLNPQEFLVWIEPSPLYKTFFNEIYFNFSQNGLEDKDCLLYYHRFYKEATSCDEEFPAICAYNTLNLISSPLCPHPCKPSGFSSNSLCFCLHQDVVSATGAEFTEPYQNEVYKGLTNEPCGFGLIRNQEGNYMWNVSRKEIGYTYWSPEGTFGAGDIYGTVTPSGWVMSSEPPKCMIVEVAIDNVEPSINLTYSEDKNEFQLEIVNLRGLKELDDGVWAYCFTNAVRAQLYYRYPFLEKLSQSNSNLLYSFPPQDDGLGSYWCEAVRYLDSEIIVSRVDLGDLKESNDYVLILELNYDPIINALNHDLVNFVWDLFCSEFSKTNNATTYTCRFMKIVKLKQILNRVTVNMHLSSQFAYQDDEEMSVQKNVIAVVGEINKTVPMKLRQFASSSFCFAETNKQLTWRKTPKNTKTRSQEFCFDSESELVLRDCKGNFLDGAVWGSVRECRIAPQSSISSDLASLLDDFSDLNLEKLHNLTEEPHRFNALDVYLSAVFLRSSLSNRNDNRATFLKIINNLLNVEKMTLQESQSKMKGTFIIFSVLQEVLTLESIRQPQPNFIVESFKDLSVCGIALQNINETYTENQIKCDSDFERIQEIAYLESAIVLGNASSVKFDFINFVMFWNSALFIAAETSVESNVFSLSIANLRLSEAEISVTLLHRNLSDDDDEKFCSSWDSQNSKWIHSELSTTEKFMICEFQYNPKTAYAITSKAKLKKNQTANVTDDLISILHSKNRDADVTDQALSVSTRFEEFESRDIYLLGKIFMKINQSEDVHLGKFAQIVSNVQKIDPTVLKESQQRGKATDSLLQHVDTILQNHKYKNCTQEITEKFIILIHDLTNSFSGFALLKDKAKYYLKVLEGDFSLEEYQNLESALVLTPALKHQLPQASKIIVTVFLDNILFQEENNSSKLGSIILGVLLPEIGDYSSPLSIYYKLPINNTQKKCAHWFYNKSSFWKNDDNGKVVNNMVQCDFWHTTHFALLLLDKDVFEDKYNILDKTTIICDICSLCGLLLVLLTALLFKKWRTETSNRILLNFVFILILKTATFYLSKHFAGHLQDYEVCTIMGAVLQFCVLAEFFWMLTIAFLQYNRFVLVFKIHKKILLKSLLFGWVPPSIPVVVLLVVDRDNYAKGNVGLCYPSGLGLYLGVWFPIGLILTINFIFYVKIMYSVIFRRVQAIGNGNEKKYQARLGIFLFFMLGLTWFFGFLAELSCGDVFIILFNVTTSLQGYIIFLFFIIFNKSTRQLYVQSFKKSFRK